MVAATPLAKPAYVPVKRHVDADANHLRMPTE